MSFNPNDVKASKMVRITTKFEVLPPLEEWHLNLEVGSQVYVLLEGFKQLQKATLWPDTTSLLHRGGFQNGVRENTPPGCYSSTSSKRVFSTPVRNLHLGSEEAAKQCRYYNHKAGAVALQPGDIVMVCTDGFVGKQKVKD